MRGLYAASLSITTANQVTVFAVWLFVLCLRALNMAHKLWQQRRKEGWKMVQGGYIPPVLHSFLRTLKKFN